MNPGTGDSRRTLVFLAASFVIALFVGYESAGNTAAVFAVVALGTLGVGAGLLLTYWAADSITDRQFLFRIFCIGLGLRLAIALFQYNYLSVDFFAPDQNSYHLLGSRGAEGLAAGRDFSAGTEWKHRFYIFYVSVLYYLVGPNPLVPSVLNSVYGCAVAVLLYRITADLDRPEAGRYAALLGMFTPSHMLWSALNLRDTPTILALVLAVYFTVRLKQEFSGGAVIGFVLSMLVLLGLRYYIFVLALGSLVIGYLGVRSGRMAEFLAGGILFLGAAMILYQAAPPENEFLRSASLSGIQSYRQGMVEGAESAYLVDADVSTPLGALLYLPVGLAYFLLAPFPWQWGSLRQLIAVPETLFWYALIPATLAGFIRLAREKMAVVLPLYVLMASVTLSYSMVQGNVGTAFRHRAQVIVFAYIFAGIGLRLRRAQQQPEKPPPEPGLPATVSPAVPSSAAG